MHIPIAIVWGRPALWITAALWALAPGASAQPPTATPAPNTSVGQVRQDRLPTAQASRATTPVPPVAYRSVFKDLSKGVEPKVLDWKASPGAKP